MPVGNPSNGVGLFAGQLMLTSSFVYQYIDWYHDPTSSEPGWKHKGKFYSTLITPELSIGLSDDLNISLSQTVGLRWMTFSPEWILDGDSPSNFVSDHHRDEDSMSDFYNAEGGLLGDINVKAKYLLSYTAGGVGPRSFISAGFLIPSKNSLTSDPYFQKTIDLEYGNNDGEVTKDETDSFNQEHDEKSHKHFALSEGVYRFIIEPSYFYKRRFNPVFLGVSLSYSHPISEAKFGESTYEAGAVIEAHFTSLFVSSQIDFIRNYVSPLIDFSFGVSISNMRGSSWNGYPSPLAESIVIFPSFGMVIGTKKFGAFNLILRTSYYLEGRFATTSEFGDDFEQGVKELDVIINYRLPIDYYIPFLE